MHRFFNICKSVSVTHYINKLKNKNHMIISKYAEKAFGKIQHQFMIKKKKTLQKVGIEGAYLNIMKAIYNKPTANITYLMKSWKYFLKDQEGTRQESPLLSYLFNIVLEILSSIQFSRSVMSDSLRPHGLQHTRPPCPSPTPKVYSNSCPLSQWCYPTISSSVERMLEVIAMAIRHDKRTKQKPNR